MITYRYFQRHPDMPRRLHFYLMALFKDWYCTMSVCWRFLNFYLVNLTILFKKCNSLLNNYDFFSRSLEFGGIVAVWTTFLVSFCIVHRTLLLSLVIQYLIPIEWKNVKQIDIIRLRRCSLIFRKTFNPILKWSELGA